LLYYFPAKKTKKQICASSQFPMSLPITIITIMTREETQAVVVAVSSKKKSSMHLVRSEKFPVTDMSPERPTNPLLLAIPMAQ